MHVIPQHLVNANFKNALKVCIHWFWNNSRNPQFVDVNGNRITDNAGVIELRDKYPGFKFVFFVEEKNLEKAKEIAEKHGVDFYQK